MVRFWREDDVYYICHTQNTPMNTASDFSGKSLPEDALDLLHDGLEQEKDPNRKGEFICTLLDEMMGQKNIADVVREVEEEVKDTFAGKARTNAPKKAGHMSERNAVEVLQKLTSALHEVMVREHKKIKPENLNMFHEYEDRAERRIESANFHAAEIEKKTEVEKKSQGQFRADRRSDQM